MSFYGTSWSMPAGRFPAIGILLALGVVSASAQSAADIGFRNPQATLQQVNGPGSTAAIAQSAGVIAQPNNDLAGLKVVNKYPVPDMFTVSTDQSAFWTDNAFLTQNDTRSSFGYNGRLRAAYVPYSTRDWTPTISFEQQFVRYDSASVLDFDGQTAQVTSQYAIIKDKSLTWTASYSLTRLYTDRLSLGEFYKESFLDDGITWVIPISAANQVYFVAGYDIGWRLTDPQEFSRVDNTVVASVVYLPLPELRVQAYLRPAVYAYTDNREVNLTTGDTFLRGRTDYNVAVGASASYTPIKYVTLTFNMGWTGNYSNVGDREYTQISPAIVLSGSFAF